MLLLRTSQVAQVPVEFLDQNGSFHALRLLVEGPETLAEMTILLVRRARSGEDCVDFPIPGDLPDDGSTGETVVDRNEREMEVQVLGDELL